MSKRKINVGIVGLGFGAEFIPIYQRHPCANMYAICQRTREKLNAIGDAFGVENRQDDFNQLLNDPNIDAVHINSPIPDHAWQSIAALKPANTSPAPCRWRPASRTARKSWTSYGRRKRNTS